MTIWKWVGGVAAVLAIAGSFLFFRFYHAAGQLTSIHQLIPANCRSIDAVPGPEDIVIDRARGLAFVSAVDRRAVFERGEDAAIRGGIYVIDLTEPRDQWALRPVTAMEPADFRPHGLGLYIGEDGSRRLFVVNHPSDGVDRIEIFSIGDNGLLTHLRSVSDPLLHNVNDVQPVGPEAFYATNDHGSGGVVGRFLQDFLIFDQADLVYFDGAQARVAADGLTYANGVNVSPDGKTVYVAETLDMTLRLYSRDVASGALTQTDQVFLGTGLDNIDVLENGSLLIGAHPRLLDFAAHAGDAKERSPGQVVRIDFSDTGNVAWTPFLTWGDDLSGISVAAGYGDQMLVGAVFDPTILACDLAQAPSK